MMLVTLTLTMAPPFMVAQLVGLPGRSRFECFYYRLVCRIMGIKVHRRGGVHHGRAVLYVANHVSYLDIPIIGAMTRSTFVAKSEIANWPLIGFMSRLRGTAFVRRNSTDAVLQRTQLAQRLGNGESLVLFPEGTSTSGSSVLPFKSALFASLYPRRDSQPIADVQPVTLGYRADHRGVPLDTDARDLFAWYGDADLIPHLWSMLGRPGVTVDAVFHEPILPHQAEDRKWLARRCEDMISSALSESLSGNFDQGGNSLSGERRKLRFPRIGRRRRA